MRPDVNSNWLTPSGLIANVKATFSTADKKYSAVVRYKVTAGRPHAPATAAVLTGEWLHNHCTPLNSHCLICSEELIDDPDGGDQQRLGLCADHYSDFIDNPTDILNRFFELEAEK